MPGIIEDECVYTVELYVRVGGNNLERKLPKTGINFPIPFERDFKIMPVNGIDIMNGDIHTLETKEVEDAFELAKEEVSGRNYCCV
jgi:hypothetical protein